MNEKIKPDPAVLGRIILLQSAIHAQPDEEKLGEFLIAGLMRIPGVSDVLFCHEGHIYAFKPETAITASQICIEHFSNPVDKLTCLAECPFEPKAGGGYTRLALKGLKRSYGGILLKVDQPEEYEPYRPFIENTANMVALLLENRDQHRKMERLNQDLEAQVDWRTLELQEELATRKKAERELQNNQSRLKSLFESIQAGIVIQEADGTISQMNRLACEVLQVTPEQVLGKTSKDPMWHMVDQDGREISGEDHPAMITLRSGKSIRGAIVGIYANNPEYKRWLLINTEPVFDRDGKTVSEAVSTFLDITGLRQTEEQLRQSRQLLRLILDTIPVRVFWKDTECRYLGCNLLFARDAGLDTADEILNKTDYDLNWQEQAGNYRSDDQQVMQSGRPRMHYEEPQTTADGKNHWLLTSKIPLKNDDGQLFGVLGTYEDITEKKQAEEALRQSESRFRSIFDTSPVGIALAETHSQRIVQVNDSLCRMLGYSCDDLTSLSISDISHPEDFSRERQLIREKLQSENDSVTFDKRFIRKDGSICWARLTAGLLKQSSEMLPLVLGIVEDITEARRAEEERKKLEAQVQHAQKLESLGVLAGGIAHDFNNLLMAILGNADLARSELSAASPAQGYLKDIETASRRAAGLCQQMLAYSGRGRFVVEYLSINEVVQEMTHMLEVSISKKAVLKFHLAPELPSIEADATQMRQIIMNLITNASEAIGDRSGIISITTGAMRCDKTYLQDTFLDEELPEALYVYVEVADTGCGMTQEVVSRIFDPFFTTKFSGRGLGMAAVLGIVRGHRGAIKVYSEPGQGTTIKILFPASDEMPERKNTVKERPKRWQGSGTILVVDDDETVRTLAGRMVEKLGFQTLFACDGREAIAIYMAHQDEIVCVLLDLTMPHMDGEETFRELRRINKDVRVIMSSGYNEQEVTQRFLGKGLTGFIQKPYRLAVLEEKLKQVFSN
jgi:PAS domain S-box-containing protein